MTRVGIRGFVRRVGSYGIVSVICFLANNVLLIALDAIGLPLWLILILSGCTMIPLGYVLQSTFTFDAPLNWPAFGRYALMILPNLPFAYGLLWLLHDVLVIPMHFAAPIATTLMLLWNFAGSSWALHRRPKNG